MIDGEHIVGDIDRGTRKRKKNSTTKERKREIRYSDVDPDLLNFEISCVHKSKQFKCKELLISDIKTIKQKFYNDDKNTKNLLDNKLAQMMDIKETKRQRKRKNGKSHDFHTEFNVWKNGKKVLVCKTLFSSIFNCGPRRINTIARKKMQGKGIRDNRGGDMKSQKNVLKLESVMKFISSLKGHESHYGRAKSRRIYLSSEYNIKLLWKMYNGQVQDDLLQTNYKYFSRIFSNKFNIAFGSPATDVCGFCIKTKTEIDNSKDIQKKIKLKTELTIHKTRAQQFFKLMKEELADSVTYCFDLQQVQALPKAPITEAFYAQQLAFYIFCVTDVSTKNPVFDTWMEHEAGRGVVEISSALTDFLRRTDFDPDVKHLRLFSDGCGGQNKNSHMVHALMLWLFNDAPKTIETITMTFPVRGHSFMPADRVFGQVEIVLRSHAFIKSPEKYYEIYSKKGEVRKLGSNWILYDIKDAVLSLKKITGISTAKRIIITRGRQTTTGEDKILFKTELLYRNDDSSKKPSSSLKPKKKLSKIVLQKLPIQHAIKKKKLDSLSKFLVSLSGKEWATDPDLTWLDTILKKQYGNVDEEKEEQSCDQCEDDEECCCLVEDNIDVI